MKIIGTKLYNTGLYIFFVLIFLSLCSPLFAQKINRIKSDNINLVYFGKRYTYLTPHVLEAYHNSMNFHSKLWNYTPTDTYVILNDFEDIGNGGAITIPLNTVVIGIEPYNFAFSIIPSNERFQWLFNHELTHVVLTENPNKRDLFFRNAMFGKVKNNSLYPLSAVWSYFTTPRWYAPRWFHEGIACFMETWMSGGLGRSMGYYDEMYFRSIVNEQKPIYSLTGLETEGTTIDFQVGANSYLYGSRFVTYLANEYGVEKLIDWYRRSDDSKAFYASQFKKVYGRPVKEEWERWRKWEEDFQMKNLRRIEEYPVTEFLPLTPSPLGSVSRVEYNKKTGKLYAAVNYPGKLSHVAEIDINTGKVRKVATVDSPVLYYTTHLTLDKEREKIYITEQNTKYRNLVEIDIKSGKKRVVNKFTRTGEIVINEADQAIWGVMHDNGYSILVKIPKPYDRVVPMYTMPFGIALFDLDISNNGEKLIGSMSGVSGEQSLVMFDINDIESGIAGLKKLFTVDENTLTQFKFSDDDRYLIGTSYYTGVSNVWRLKLEDNTFELLSNTETGLFMPFEYGKDSLLVLKYYRDGMIPGKISKEVITSANAIDFLGNLVHQNNPVVEEWSLPPASSTSGSHSLIEESIYKPWKNMKLIGAYPDISGYKETIALGYRIKISDPVGLSNINLLFALSPWSNYQSEQKIHLMFEWKLWNWNFNANYNPVHFYDLFGPKKRSRAGYSVGVEHRKNSTLRTPFKTFYQFGGFFYGNLELLPEHQNVESPLISIGAFTASYGLSKLRRTLGAVIDERGFSWEVKTKTYFAKSGVYSSVLSNQDFGFLLPFRRNTSFWIRSSVGQSLTKRGSALSSFYFGGFRNNYVDWQPVEQYRNALAFPGAEIDAIAAYNYVKTMGELNLRPLRIRNTGTTWLYPTYVKSSLFATHLLTDFDKSSLTANIFNIGGQIDFQIVLFSYLRSTWSVGYARMLQKDKPSNDMLMLSLKLLGE